LISLLGFAAGLGSALGCNFAQAHDKLGSNPFQFYSEAFAALPQ
jgi:hypothetical protein